MIGDAGLDSVDASSQISFELIAVSFPTFLELEPFETNPTTVARSQFERTSSKSE